MRLNLNSKAFDYPRKSSEFYPPHKQKLEKKNNYIILIWSFARQVFNNGKLFVL